MSASPAPLVPPCFSRSLNASKRRLSSQDIEIYELATFSDIKHTIDSIQKEQAKRRGYRNLNKIKPMVDCLQQYARVIEQFVSAKPDFLAFIWVSHLRSPKLRLTLVGAYQTVSASIPANSSTLLPFSPSLARNTSDNISDCVPRDRCLRLAPRCLARRANPVDCGYSFI